MLQGLLNADAKVEVSALDLPNTGHQKELMNPDISTPPLIDDELEHGTGRLLGAQIVGGADAGKRIDVLATALWNGMTVAEMAGMDLSYAPPFSPVWDPVLLAAGKAAAEI